MSQHVEPASQHPRHARLFELIRQVNLAETAARRPSGDALVDSVAASLQKAARVSLRAMM